MVVIVLILGAFVGLAFAQDELETFGFVAGAAIAYLAYRNWVLKSALDVLRRDVEQRLSEQHAPASPRVTEPPTVAEPQTTEEPSEAPETRAAEEPPEATEPREDAPQEDESLPTPPRPAEPPVSRPAARVEEPVPQRVTGPPAPALSASDLPASDLPAPDLPAPDLPPATFDAERPESSALDRAITAARTWLTTGNVPVKIGMIILFFGVGFLLKYAIDQQLLNLPIELRLLVVATGGVALLVFGWRIRDSRPDYAINLQGGGIGILYLTIFAAFRFWALLPVPVAFGLLVVLTIIGGWLAVAQDTRALAVMASIGGFLAPVLVSTDSGNHVALFSYYLVINCAILGISWYRAWRSLNLIGFGFTFGVGTFWGFQYYTPELYASTQPFLIVNFLFYLAIAVLFALRQPPKLRGLVDGTLVFGTPVVAFFLQAQLVSDTEYGLAISAGAAALIYAAVSVWLHRTQTDQLRLLRQAFTALGAGFATIAVPLALDHSWSAGAWALEGAGLVWLGVRQNGRLARLTGTALIFASGVFYLAHGWRDDVGWPVLNGNVLGGVLIAGAALFAARWLRENPSRPALHTLASFMLFVWASIWWLGTGTAEINDRWSDHASDFHRFFEAASFCGLAWLARRDSWTLARVTSYLAFPLFALFGLGYAFDHGHFLYGLGWLSWPALGAACLFVLRAAEGVGGRVLPLMHSTFLFGLAAFLACEVLWRMREAGFNDVWIGSAAIASQLVLVAALLLLCRREAWPLARYAGATLTTAVLLLTFQLFALLRLSVTTSGDPHPWPYIPVLNPIDFLILAILAVAAGCGRAWRDVSTQRFNELLRPGLVILTGFALTLSTLSVVRLVHHFGSVSWDWPALRSSVSVQAALSIYWALLGVAGMVLGTRHRQYWTWLAGVGLMGVVVLKLFFVDLGNTGTVARIVSFLGVGALLLAVGYVSPRPPKPESSETHHAE
ncbi:MAG: DUF2339 domain-containing protein [Acidobacteriota bacterium]